MRALLFTALTSQWSYTLLSCLAVVGIYWARSPAKPAPPPSNDGWCAVIKVVDGDSVNVRCGQHRHRLRLMHIDAPEMRQKPWGARARTALKHLLTDNIYVEFHGRDVYQRDLAVIYADRQQPALNWQLVEQGAVRVYRRYKPPKPYVSAMRRAKKARLGIWRQKGLHQDPMRFRRLSH